MRASFDVLTQPWIPVVDAQGRTGELGILDALTQAEQWKGIQDPSPLVEYSIYRFLIVFLMDALRPQDLDALEELLDEGHFDRAALCGYECEAEQAGAAQYTRADQLIAPRHGFALRRVYSGIVPKGGAECT